MLLNTFSCPDGLKGVDTPEMELKMFFTQTSLKLSGWDSRNGRQMVRILTEFPWLWGISQAWCPASVNSVTFPRVTPGLLTSKRYVCDRHIWVLCKDLHGSYVRLEDITKKDGLDLDTLADAVCRHVADARVEYILVETGRYYYEILRHRILDKLCRDYGSPS